MTTMNTVKSDKVVVVTGDVTMDWNLARTRRSKSNLSSWRAEDSINTYWQRGGSALLADLVQATASELHRSDAVRFTIRQTGAPHKPLKVNPANDQYHHSYALWSLFKYGEKISSDKESPAWRVEEFLGLDRATDDTVQNWQKVVDDTPKPNLVILDDANLGFRNHPDVWPLALNIDQQVDQQDKPWILLKMARPLAQGALWEHLYHHFADQMIVVATVDDLRLSEVQISDGLSWERTAQDVFWELVHNPCVNSLSHCAHVVISFGTAGAILLSRTGEPSQPQFQCSLFFDPKGVERMWEQNHKGGMIGYTTCLTAAIVRQLMICPSKPDMPLGVQSGLTAMRTLHMEGYGERGTAARQSNLAFPTKKIALAFEHSKKQFAMALVQNPMRFIQDTGESSVKPLVEGYWTILQDCYSSTLEALANQIVFEGPEVALQGVPWGQFGNLLTVDRQEIESFRSIRNLIFEYCQQGQQKRPLSIAVFGTPGSGKSFGIIEIAKSLLPDQIEVREFNLSQFDSIDNLLAAFHQVRDIGLSGKIPLVFWDEFDCTVRGVPLSWLHNFLAPMQDGRFQEGQISHPIGRAIFVFAGGTSSSMAGFGQGLDAETFTSVKGPDFVSRLKGYINIVGPNPVKARDLKAVADPHFVIRRAILLRSMLKRSLPQLFEPRGGKELLNIDRGVLRAFLKIDEFKHGARSIESLFSMSQLADKAVFERSCLPAESLLDLHVDGRAFLSLVQQVELDGKVLEELAEAAHEMFTEGLTARGYQYASQTDTVLKTNSALMPYASLSEGLKNENRLNVRDIPIKLALAHYIMVPARSNQPSFNFPGTALETLAEAEHTRWVQSLFEKGWEYAPDTDTAKHMHKCLVSWDKLPEDEKEKDRDLVRGIPKILARAGYTVVKE